MDANSNRLGPFFLALPLLQNRHRGNHMKSEQNKMKKLGLAVFSLFVLVGSYNAFVINSDSDLSQGNRFLKRLDETFGVTVQGRSMAGSVSWQKIDPKRLLKRSEQLAKLDEVKREIVAEKADASESAVSEELSLGLVEVINPKKYMQGLATEQFNGSLSSANGVIESLSVSLPNGEGLSVSFSELTGNVFEYEMNGELFSGMMYQVDKNSYMVTLTNGPLEGTRLRFSSEQPSAQQEQIQETLAQSNVEIGLFGSEPVEASSVEQVQAEDAPMVNFQSAGFDMNQPASI